MRRQDGFTLIELMVVVLIIGILVAIAVPALLRYRQNANETSAIASLRTISTAEVQFKTAGHADADHDGNGDYGTLAQLAAPPGGTTPFVDAALGSGAKQGYTFTVNVVAGGTNVSTSYQAFADPLAPGTTGVRRFFVDPSGVIRYTSDGSQPGPDSQGM